ncbi:alcohol acetyltransferase [Treponema sp.]
MKSEDPFYRLDNSAVFMAAIAGSSGPFVFRLSCTLKKTVRLDALQEALESLTTRFPFLFVSLQSGVFWYYLDPVDAIPRVERETAYPAAAILKGRSGSLLRVTAYGRRIACDFHHAITDGTGAIAFIRALLLEYFYRTEGGLDIDEKLLEGIPRAGEAVDPEEEEDAYARVFRSQTRVPDAMPMAFLIPGSRLIKMYRDTVGILQLKQALQVSKRHSVTLTEFLAAVHLATLQDIYENLSPSRRRRSKKHVAVQIPINLRKLYPSRTLRNFFLFAAPYIDLRLGHWDFEEILRRVHHQLKLGIEEKELLRQVKRNVGGERNPFGRPILLPIKNMILRSINAAIGVGAYSGSITNLGAIALPEILASHIERFAILPSRARATGANVGVLSWQDSLYITIGSLVRDSDFERLFFSRLVSLGLDVRVESSFSKKNIGGLSS